MSHLMTALAMRQTGLKPAAKIVLYWLADHHNSDTELCFPSLSLLAEECEMDKSTVVRHISSLEDSGLISKVKRLRGNGSQTSTAYTLHLGPVAKYNTPCSKMQQPPVAKCHPLNLVNTNLVIEPEDICEKAFAIFSEYAEVNGWTVAQKLSKARLSKIKARLKECSGIEGWKVALEKAQASDFLCSRTNANFKMTIDFILQESSFTKLMEGNYDNRTNNTTGRTQNKIGDAQYDEARQRALNSAARRPERGDDFF